MSVRDVVGRIEHYNQGREPERLEMKYARMATDPFTFFRGTCHLFYEDLPEEEIFREAPAVWVCGDLHLENFGSYRGDNGLAYFDVNDFDEGGLAPATWELARFLTSLWLAAEKIQVNPKQGLSLERIFLDAYVAALADGKARWVERDTAVGMIRDLLSTQQGRRAFLEGRTDRTKDGRRRLKLSEGKALAVSPEERQTLERFMGTFAQAQSRPRFFQFRDVARRVAGTGSLGVRRYVLLVEGKGSPDDNCLLDLKKALPSSLEGRFQLPQPAWKNPAARVVSIQQRMQAIAPALLRPVDFERESWVLRELQPTSDRLSLESWNGRLNRLEEVLHTMGELVAWGQLRSSGREGSANADALIAFAAEHDRWRGPLVEYAQAYSDTVHQDWREFRRWWMDRERKR